MIELKDESENLVDSFSIVLEPTAGVVKTQVINLPLNPQFAHVQFINLVVHP